MVLVISLFIICFYIMYFRLTDEEARKNWETYGNPDGPGRK